MAGNCRRLKSCRRLGNFRLLARRLGEDTDLELEPSTHARAHAHGPCPAPLCARAPSRPLPRRNCIKAAARPAPCCCCGTGPVLRTQTTLANCAAAFTHSGSVNGCSSVRGGTPVGREGSPSLRSVCRFIGRLPAWTTGRRRQGLPACLRSLVCPPTSLPASQPAPRPTDPRRPTDGRWSVPSAPCGRPGRVELKQQIRRIRTSSTRPE